MNDSSSIVFLPIYDLRVNMDNSGTTNKLRLIALITPLVITSCGGSSASKMESELRKSLLFYASYDSSTTADYAKGDPVLYNAPSRAQLDAAAHNLNFATSVKLVADNGKYGGALEFKDNLIPVVFYKADKNVNFQPQNWSGTISFWLKVDPDQDLSKSYVDPIQITETGHRDAAIWADFTPTNKKRMFRLGVSGDEIYWSSDDKDIATKGFYHRVRGILDPPFSGDVWTHVAITHDKLGSGNGSANLYLNGILAVTHSPIKDPFTWEYNNANIYLGLRYSGLIDELVIFDREISATEVNYIYKNNINQ